MESCYKENEFCIITWGNEIRRSESLSSELGASNYHFPKISKYRIINYIFALYKTVKLITSQNYKYTILVLPPTLMLYSIPLSKLFKRKTSFILDMHNGVVRKEWKSLPFIKSIISKCRVVISHNSYVKTEIDKVFSCDSFVLPDPTIPSKRFNFHTGKLEKLAADKINIFVPVSYAADEPIEEIINVASSLKEKFNFILSGNQKRYFEGDEPKHISFTNFISKEEYFSYIRESDIILCLTKDINIQMCALVESISLRKNIICTNSRVNKDLFGFLPIEFTDLDEHSMKNIINNYDIHNKPYDLEMVNGNWRVLFNNFLNKVNS